MGLEVKSIITLFGLFFINLTSCYRLPDSVVPEHYTLEIISNLGDENNNFDFLGKVWIQVLCNKPTQNITLHFKNLTIHKDEIKIHDISEENGHKNQIKTSGFEVVKDDDFFIIHLAEPLTEEHKYDLYIPFTGILQDGLSGYYRSTYVDKATKKKKYLAVTQFEPTDARRAFPCFDEPAMKATFNISIGRMEKYNSISNMPLMKTEPIKEKEGWFWDRFEKSVPMSTYLLAFMVSDFVYKTSEPYGNNVTFRIWSRKDALNQVEYAREVGPKFLNYYEKFFDIKYPLPKQDMIALPDFNAGAMENWGMITYREAYLLYDPEVSSSYSKQSVASVIAHELAHQWFGNLVTMKWWTDLWLNEGFATYMATLAVDHVHPEWNSLNEEAIDDLFSVFAFDSLQTSHPVSVTIGHPREIDEIFDTISYKKGSSIIRMMGLFLGEEILRKGVSNYLEKHKYNNAEQNDLWESLTEEAHKHNALPRNLTIKTIMDTWTIQTGYPVLHINRLYGQNAVEVSQERYLRDTNKLLKLSPQCWWVPISYTTEEELDFNSTLPKHWLSCTNEKQVFEGFPGDDKWVIFNIQGAGLYRVNYDEKNWKMLINTLNSDKFKDISVFSRVQLIDNSASLAWTDHLKYDVFFDILKYLDREEEFLPWESGMRNINGIHRLLKKTTNYGKFSIYMKKLLTNIYAKMGGLHIPQEIANNLEAVKFKTLVVASACKFEVANCVSDSINLFKEMQKEGNSSLIPKDLRKMIYCQAVRFGGEKEWNYLWNMYQKSNVASEKSHILNSLGCSREIWLLQRYIDWTLQPNSGIRKQDASSVFTSVATSEVGYFVAKTFFEDKIQEIYKSMVKAKRLSRYISALASQMMTEKEYDELLNFTQTNAKYLVDAKQGVEQSLETVKLNVQWHKQHYENIGKLLQKY